MNALLVGADQLGNLPGVLAELGIRVAGHISGRAPAHQRQAALPAEVELVILFTDFLGHNAMRHFRAAARARGLPLLCCRRSSSSLRRAVATCLGRTCDACPRRATAVKGD